MARSRWKFSFFSRAVWKKIFIVKKKKGSIFYNDFIKKKNVIHTRNSTIPLCFKKIKFLIHKGKNYRPVRIVKQHTSYKFGELAFTRKVYYYPLRKKKRKLIRC